jgi:Tfp pilus assembly protein PilO
MSNASLGKSQRPIPAGLVHGAGGALALGMGALFVVLVLMPVQARRSQAQTDKNQLQAAQQTLVSTDEKIEAAQQQIGALQKQLEHAVQLQSAAGVNRVVQQVTDAATAAGLAVHEVTPGEREAGSSKEYAVLPIRLTATGAFADVLTFLEQSNDRFRDIATLGMSVRRSDGDGQRVTVALELAWYTLPGEGAEQSGGNDDAGATR